MLSRPEIVIIYSPGIDPFLEDLAKGVDRALLRGGVERITHADFQDMAENKGSEDPGSNLLI